VPDQRLIDAVGADLQATPLRARQARGDSARPEPRLPPRERDDALLDHL
jgi:hypothetical protein